MLSRRDQSIQFLEERTHYDVILLIKFNVSCLFCDVIPAFWTASIVRETWKGRCILTASRIVKKYVIMLLPESCPKAPLTTFQITRQLSEVFSPIKMTMYAR